MSYFSGNLILQDDNGFPMALMAQLCYFSSRLNRTIVVPVGFKTDLASIPRGLWNILPKEGRYDKAAVVHDYLYAINGLSRADADSILLEGMETLGVGWWTRHTIYLGVRAGGWLAWDRYRSRPRTS